MPDSSICANFQRHRHTPHHKTHLTTFYWFFSLTLFERLLTTFNYNVKHRYRARIYRFVSNFFRFVLFRKHSNIAIFFWFVKTWFRMKESSNVNQFNLDLIFCRTRAGNSLLLRQLYPSPTQKKHDEIVFREIKIVALSIFRECSRRHVEDGPTHTQVKSPVLISATTQKQ